MWVKLMSIRWKTFKSCVVTGSTEHPDFRSSDWLRRGRRCPLSSQQTTVPVLFNLFFHLKWFHQAERRLLAQSLRRWSLPAGPELNVLNVETWTLLRPQTLSGWDIINVITSVWRTAGGGHAGTHLPGADDSVDDALMKTGSAPPDSLGVHLSRL